MADAFPPLNKSMGPAAGAAPEMTLKREMYFPTVIYSLDLPDRQRTAEMNRRLAQHIYAWREQDAEGLNRSNARSAGSWHSPSDMAKRLEFSELVDLVFFCAHAVFRDSGYDEAHEPVIDNMWANLNPRGGYNRSHFHPNVLWSGVYYVQTPPNCGNICFFDPRTEACMILPRLAADQTPKLQNQNEISFNAVEGRIILFPSWLAHEVEANMTDVEGPAGDRISVSFNIMQRR